MCLFGVSVRDKAHVCLEMEMMGLEMLEMVELDTLEMMESVGDAVFSPPHLDIFPSLLPYMYITSAGCFSDT